jgi:hypothetical protein
VDGYINSPYSTDYINAASNQKLEQGHVKYNNNMVFLHFLPNILQVYSGLSLPRAKNVYLKGTHAIYEVS